jgi:hypothetical protein
VAATHRRGIAKAALSCAGQANAGFFGIVVVVVDAGTVVVVDVGDVVVVTGTVVVDAGTVVVVTTTVVEVVLVVVVGGVDVAHALGTVVVDASAGLSWADVVVAVTNRTDALSASVSSVPRRSRWWVRRVTQRIYSPPLRAPVRGLTQCTAAHQAHTVDTSAFNDI